MNLISKLLRPTHVLLGLDTADKNALFEHVSRLFATHDPIARDVVYDSLQSRERLGSTGMGHGLAIPHGRVKHLKETLCAFVRTAQPIGFDAPDGQAVDLIFVVLVPDHANEYHLQILSELANMFSDAGMRDQLRACGDLLAAHKLLTEWSPYAPGKRSAAI